MIGKAIRPTALLAEGWQADRAALLAAEARPGDPAVAQPGRRSIDGSGDAAVAAGHLDLQMVPRQVAERGQGCRQGHSPICGSVACGRNSVRGRERDAPPKPRPSAVAPHRRPSPPALTVARLPLKCRVKIKPQPGAALSVTQQPCPCRGPARAAGSAFNSFPTHLTRSLSRRRAGQGRGFPRVKASGVRLQPNRTLPCASVNSATVGPHSRQ